MPGPKMGARPVDFDENVVRQAPTFQKWMALKHGERIRYACRDFIKGNGDDEERLMRRIMIARRNNLRDHDTLKKARTASREEELEALEKKRKAAVAAGNKPPKRRARHPGYFGMSDEEVMAEIDMPAVEATRSFKTWLTLADGKEFTYNQKYIKGEEGHEWLLKKNIWRRMRYRRENKKMVEKMKSEAAQVAIDAAHATSVHAAAAAAVDHALAAAPTTPTPVPPSVAAAAAASSVEAAAGANSDLVHKAVVEAAVAAAESYVQKQRESETAESAAAAAAVEATAAAAAVEATAAAAAVVTNLDAATATVGNDINAIAALQPPAEAEATAPSAVADSVNNPILSTADTAPIKEQEPEIAPIKEPETSDCPVDKPATSGESPDQLKAVETPNPLAEVTTESVDPQTDGDTSEGKLTESAVTGAVKVEEC